MLITISSCGEQGFHSLFSFKPSTCINVQTVMKPQKPMIMKKYIIALYIILIATVANAQSDYVQFTRDITRYSTNYTDNEVMELYQHHYGVPQNSLRLLFDGFGYDWGSVALGLEMSNQLNVPIADLLVIYQQHPHGNGWGVMAQQCGITPGSREFSQIKSMMGNKNRYWRDVYVDYKIKQNPSIAQRNRVYIDKNLIRIGIPSSKELKRINKQIEKRNKEIYKRENKAQKQWEKDNKKIKKIRKKREKQIKKIGKWL